MSEWGTRQLSISNAISQFLSCILMHMAIPLVPLLLEYIIEGQLSQKSIAITTAMYAIALAMSSKWTWFAFMGIFISVLYAGIFGYLAKESMLEAPKPMETYGSTVICFMFITHIF